MARLFTSGFELNSATAGIEWGIITGAPTVQGTTKRSGASAGKGFCGNLYFADLSSSS